MVRQLVPEQLVVRQLVPVLVLVRALVLLEGLVVPSSLQFVVVVGPF